MILPSDSPCLCLCDVSVLAHALCLAPGFCFLLLACDILPSVVAHDLRLPRPAALDIRLSRVSVLLLLLASTLIALSASVCLRRVVALDLTLSWSPRLPCMFMSWTPALMCLRLQFSLTRACIPHLSFQLRLLRPKNVVLSSNTVRVALSTYS